MSYDKIISKKMKITKNELTKLIKEAIGNTELQGAIDDLVPYKVSYVKVEMGYNKETNPNGRGYTPFQVNPEEYADVIVFHTEDKNEADKFIAALESKLGKKVTKKTKSGAMDTKWFVSFDERLKDYKRIKPERIPRKEFGGV